MNKNISIGFIGFGNMAQAIYAGIKLNSNLSPTFYACRKSTKPLPVDVTAETYQSLFNKADIIILAIKPQQLNDISQEFKQYDFENKCLISVMAGTTLETLGSLNSSLKSIIRVMPNTSASIQKSVTLIAANTQCKQEHIDKSLTVFSSIGTVHQIEENQMDFATAMFGSGPAFIYQIMENLISICIENKLSPDISTKLIKQLFLGTSEMAHQTDKKISELIENICSPNGTTEAGLNAFNDVNISAALAQVIEAAKNRSKKLSNT